MYLVFWELHEKSTLPWPYIYLDLVISAGVKNSPVLSTTELLPATTALYNTVDIPEKAGHKLDVSQGTGTVRDSSVDI